MISCYFMQFCSGLFARALDGVNVKELITNIGSSAGAAPAGGGAPAAAGGDAEEKKGKRNHDVPLLV